jgi:hypothetical protein
LLQIQAGLFVRGFDFAPPLQRFPHSLYPVRIRVFAGQSIQAACDLHGDSTRARWIPEHSNRIDWVSDSFRGLSVARTHTFC